MKTLKIFAGLCLLVIASCAGGRPAYAQQHQNTVSPGVWVWPTPLNANSAESQSKFKSATAWLSKHGYPGGYALAFFQFEAVAAPGGDNPPNWPFVSFCKDWAGTQPALQFDHDSWPAWTKLDSSCQISDFAAFLQDPPVALTELENKYQFGDPTVLIQYPDRVPVVNPDPPGPVVKNPLPVGNEITQGSGTYYALDPSFAEWTDFRGHFVLVTRDAPFGTGKQKWFKLDCPAGSACFTATRVN